MKKNLFYFLILLVVTACAQNKKAVVFGDETNKLAFTHIYKDLGVTTEGDLVSFEYEFTNTGESSISILNAVPTCGCVAVKYPSQPILPNKKGVLKVSFDSKGKNGLNKKSIVVQTSLAYPNDIIELSFEVKVEAQKK